MKTSLQLRLSGVGGIDTGNSFREKSYQNRYNKSIKILKDPSSPPIMYGKDSA